MPSLVFKTGGGRSSIAVLSLMDYRHFPGQIDLLKAVHQSDDAGHQHTASLVGAEQSCVLSYPSGVMEEQNNEADQKSKQVRKAIGDLDDLVQAVRTSLPPAKPWQRQLLAHLTEVDRQIQILRVTLSLRRADEEVAEATEQLRVALRVAQRYVATGRADLATRAAVLLACELGLKVNASLA